METKNKIKLTHLVDAFLHASFQRDDGTALLRFFQDHFWVWNGTHYVKKEDATIHREFSLYLEKTHKIPSRSDWSTLKELLEFRTMLSEDQAMPAWIGKVTPDTQNIAFHNGLLSLYTGQLSAHSPEWFSSNCLPYDYDPGAACPKWLEFLDQVFERDPERIALLQEWFGYSLTPDTSLHKALLLQGRPRSGKSTIVTAQTEMLGAENVSNVSLELFAERFHLPMTEGKLLNVAEEANNSRLFDEGRFKAFTAGVPLMVENKGKAPYRMIPTARIVMTANEQLYIRDLSGAIGARLVIIPFNVTFVGREDRELGAKLKAELAGIFNWSLEGQRRLRSNKKFTVSKIGEEELAETLAANNPIALWSEECLDTSDSTVETPSSVIYACYTKWCKESQVKPLTKPRLGREYRMALGLSSSWKPILVKQFGQVIRVWPGVKPQDGWGD